MASQVIVFYEDVAQKSVLQDMQVAALLPLTKKLISSMESREAHEKLTRDTRIFVRIEHGIKIFPG